MAETPPLPPAHSVVAFPAVKLWSEDQWIAELNWSSYKPLTQVCRKQHIPLGNARVCKFSTWRVMSQVGCRCFGGAC